MGILIHILFRIAKYNYMSLVQQITIFSFTKMPKAGLLIAA